jgi:hypothetical protein
MQKVIAIDEQSFQEIINKLEKLEQGAATQKTEVSIGWLSNDQFCEALQISKRTAQNYRDNGLIDYTLISGKVYYKKSDIDAMLEKNYSGTFKR